MSYFLEKLIDFVKPGHNSFEGVVRGVENQLQTAQVGGRCHRCHHHRTAPHPVAPPTIAQLSFTCRLTFPTHCSCSVVFLTGKKYFPVPTSLLRVEKQNINQDDCVSKKNGDSIFLKGIKNDSYCCNTQSVSMLIFLAPSVHSIPCIASVSSSIKPLETARPHRPRTKT